MTGINLRFKAPGPVSRAFLNSTATVRALMGPIGSGKTSTCLIDGVLRAQRQARSPVDGVRYYKRAIVRDTYRNLESTTIPSWHTWMPATVGEWNATPPMSHHVRFQIGDGSIVDLIYEFIALGENRIEDVMRGWEGTDIQLEEADRLMRETLIFARSRIGRYPSKLHGGPTNYGVVLCFNAPDTENWTYEDLVETPIAGAEFFPQPSGFDPRAENLENLPPGYYEKQAEGQPDWFVRRMIRNAWGYSREGMPVYPEYADQRHCAAQDLEPDRGVPLELGVDAGGTPAAVIGQRRHNGQLRILDELVTEPGAGVGPKRFAELVNAKLHRDFNGLEVACAHADPSAAYGGDHESKGDDAAWLSVFAAHTHLRCRPAPTNKPSIRQDAVREPLRRTIDGDAPGYIISPRCRTLRKGFNSMYRYKRINVAGGTQFSDEPEKNHASHVHDANQYFCLGVGEFASVMNRQRARNVPIQVIGGDG